MNQENITEKSPTASEKNQSNTILSAAEEGFTPSEEKELLEKSRRLIEKIDRENEKEDDSLDIIQKPC